MNVMWRKRLSGLLVILPLLCGLAIAVYWYGPQPKRSNNQILANTSSPATQPAPVEKAALLELFGMYQAAVGQGRVQLSPTEYLNSLEEIYRKRGYAKLQPVAPGPGSAKKSRSKATRDEAPVKFFQRNDSEGFGNIFATGSDADHRSNESASEPYTFSTLVVASQGGGTSWATYKIEIDRTRLEQLAHIETGDFPGSDPSEIPRLAGLRRMYSLTTGNGSIAIYEGREPSDSALMLKYLDEMPRHGWHLDSEATAAANKVAEGVMCFTRGTRSCLIWVTKGETGATTNVTISSR